MSNFTVSYLIELRDKYTAVADKVQIKNEKLKQQAIKLKMNYDKMAASVTKNEFAARKLALQTKKLAMQEQTLINKQKSLNNSLKKITKSVSNAGQKMKNFGKSLSMYVSAPIIAMGGFMIKAAMDFEDATLVFEVMLGSAKKAKTLLADIEKMAIKTPFTSKDLIQNTKLLLNFGVEQKKLIPSLRMLGDISGGNRDRFNRLSLAYAQMAAQGRLMGQDLLQMVNAGFNPLQIISEKTGVSMMKLKDAMSKGQISFKQVQKAMKLATSEGGRFFNLMDKKSQTASGRLSTMIDKIQLLQRDLGLKLLPTFKVFLEKVIMLIDYFGKLSPRTQKWLLIIAAIAAVIPPLLISFGAMAMSISAIAGLVATVTTAQWAWNGAMLANPIGLIIVGIVALIAAIVALIVYWDKIVAAQKIAWAALVKFIKLADSFLNISRAIKIYQQNWEKIVSVIKSAWDMAVGFINAVASIGGAMGDLFGGGGSTLDSTQTSNQNVAIKELSAKDAAEKRAFSGNIDITTEKGVKAMYKDTRSKGVNVNIAPSMAGF